MSDTSTKKKEKGNGDPNIPYGPEQLPWGDLVPEGADVSAPQENPIKVYPDVPPSDLKGDFPKIHYKIFEIPPTGLTDAQRTAALAELKEFAETQHKYFTGFQVNESEKYSQSLWWLMDMHTNNVGDPFQSGIFTLNTKFCERAVLDYFAALWNNKWPHHQDTPERRYSDRYWGYVLSMGSTEANIYGLFNARDYLKGRALIEDPESEQEKKFIYVDPVYEKPEAYKPIAFYSEDTHYSVIKAVRILEVTTFCQEGKNRFPGKCPITKNGEWPDEVPSHNVDNGDSGTIDVNALEKLVRFFVEKGYPPLIVLNFGSTWKGAYDDVPMVNAMLEKMGEEFPWLWKREVHYDPDNPDLKDVRRGFWVHVDGALGAGYMPFVEMAYNRGKLTERGPIFDFRNKAVMSICTSMHKWFGAPWPGSVYMTRIGYQLQPPDVAGYIGSADTTLGGSRNAFSAVIFWEYLARHSYEESVEEVLETERVAAYMIDQLKILEEELKTKYGKDVDLWITRSKLSLAVRFRQVNPDITYKYTVDSERMWVPISKTEEQERTYAHVFIMQSVTKNLVDELIQDIREACKNNWHAAFPEWDGDQPNPGPTRPITAPKRKRGNYIVSVPHTGRGLGSFVHPSNRD